MTTTLVNKYHNIPYDIDISRKSIWGNPFSHMEGTKAKFKVDTRDEAIQKYEEWIVTQRHLMKKLHTLRGKILGCTCYPLPCHGDVLIKLINEMEN
jgi:hypothetical protein